MMDDSCCFPPPWSGMHTHRQTHIHSREHSTGLITTTILANATRSMTDPACLSLSFSFSPSIFFSFSPSSHSLFSLSLLKCCFCLSTLLTVPDFLLLSLYLSLNGSLSLLIALLLCPLVSPYSAFLYQAITSNMFLQATQLNPTSTSTLHPTPLQSREI